MKTTTLALALLAMLAVSTAVRAEIFEASAGGRVARIDGDDLWSVQVSTDRGFENDVYLEMRYNYVGELDAQGNTFPAPNLGGTFHFVPTNDPTVNNILENLIVPVENDDYASLGFGGQVYQNGIDGSQFQAFMISYMAKSEGTYNKWDLGIADSTGTVGADTEVCFRGSTGGVCDDFTVAEGDFKFAFGVNNWQYDATATHFRIQWLLSESGFDDAEVFFNGDEAVTLATIGDTQVESVNFRGTKANVPIEFDFNVIQQFNAGSNNFATAEISVEDNTGGDGILLNIDIPLALLEDANDNASGTQWWIYDPEIVSMYSSASSLSVSITLIFAAIASALLH